METPVLSCSLDLCEDKYTEHLMFCLTSCTSHVYLHKLILLRCISKSSFLYYTLLEQYDSQLVCVCALLKPETVGKHILTFSLRDFRLCQTAVDVSLHKIRHLCSKHVVHFQIGPRLLSHLDLQIN